LVNKEYEQTSLLIAKSYSNWLGNIFWEVACALTEHEIKQDKVIEN